MQKVLDQIVNIFRQGLQWIVNIVSWVWEWSGAQVSRAFSLLPQFGTLPIWKQVLMIVVALALAYLIFVIATDLWAAIKRILDAIIALLRTLLDDLLYVLLAGIIAFGGSWAINNLTIAWLP